MKHSERHAAAGRLPDPASLVDVGELLGAYYDRRPDPSVTEQRVAFGTLGHRATSLDWTTRRHPRLGAAAGLTDLSHQFDVAVANDPEADRQFVIPRERLQRSLGHAGAAQLVQARIEAPVEDERAPSSESPGAVALVAGKGIGNHGSR